MAKHYKRGDLMNKYTLTILLLIMALSLFAQPRTLPRTYVQTLVLENGELPSVTWDGKKSAPEYNLKAWITKRPKEVMNTDKSSIHALAVKNAGDGEKVPKMVIVSVQLGNFPSQWREGETLRLELRHKKSKQKITWDVLIPPGNNLIKILDEPKVVPPFSKKKK